MESLKDGSLKIVDGVHDCLCIWDPDCLNEGIQHFSVYVFVKVFRLSQDASCPFVKTLRVSLKDDGSSLLDEALKGQPLTLLEEHRLAISANPFLQDLPDRLTIGAITNPKEFHVVGDNYGDLNISVVDFDLPIRNLLAIGQGNFQAMYRLGQIYAGRVAAREDEDVIPEAAEDPDDDPPPLQPL